MLTEELEQEKVKISHLEAELSKAQLTIDWLKEQFKLYQQKQFGKSSESSELLQLPLFDYPETDIAKDEKTEQEEITYTRNKPKQKNGRNIDRRIQTRRATHLFLSDLLNTSNGVL